MSDDKEVSAESKTDDLNDPVEETIDDAVIETV